MEQEILRIKTLRLDLTVEVIVDSCGFIVYCVFFVLKSFSATNRLISKVCSYDTFFFEPPGL